MNRFRQAAQGIHILRDWLGEGGLPVPIELAQERANICLTCPFNYKGSWLWSIAASTAISIQMQLRRTMNIHLEGDDKLGICEKCGCKLALKVHVPFRHIYSHTSDEQFGKYPAFCWQSQERSKIKTI